MWYSLMPACVWQPLLTCWHLTVDLQRQAVSKQHIYIVIVISHLRCDCYQSSTLWLLGLMFLRTTVSNIDSVICEYMLIWKCRLLIILTAGHMYLHCTCYHGDIDWQLLCHCHISQLCTQIVLGDELLSQGICQFCWHYLTTEFCFLWSALAPDLVLRTGGVLAHSPWFLFLYSTINHSV